MKRILGVAAITPAMLLATTAVAAELDLMMSDVDGKVGVVADFIERYKEIDPDTTITLNQVGYDVIREQLAGQLEAGVGPDMAFVTNLGGMNPYYVDLAPYVDVDAWEAAYGAVLPWYRAGQPDGIYGFHSELTVTGPFVNVTMFDEAGVDLPGDGSTWEDWAEASRAVMEETGAYAGMIIDRSGHRFAGPAMSYGAAYFDGDGKLIIDDGFRTFAEMLVAWHEEGLMPPDIWPAVSGGKYANGNEMFFNQDVPFYYSGSWNTAQVQDNVGDTFEWRVVPSPCGPAGCGAMPGGQGLVAFDQGQSDEDKAAMARFIDWMATKENAAEFYGTTYAIPAHAELQAEGIDYTAYGASQAVSEGLNVFAAAAATSKETTPQAYDLQGSPVNFVIFNATAQYISGVMNGEMDMDQAIERIRAEIEENAQ